MENKAINGGKPRESFKDKSFVGKIWYILKSMGATLVYPNFLLFHVYKSNSVGLKQKLTIVAAFLYIIFPLDVFPDWFFGLGFADDMVALAAALTALLSCINDEVQDAAKTSLKKLLGDFDDTVLEAISKIYQKLNRLMVSKSVAPQETTQPKEENTKKIEDVEVVEVKPIEAAAQA